MRAEAVTKTDLEALRADLRSELASKSEWGALRSELNSLSADAASHFMTTRKERGDQIVGLRRAVSDDHSSVIGLGVLISDLEARMRRVDQHLDLLSLTAG